MKVKSSQKTTTGLFIKYAAFRNGRKKENLLAFLNCFFNKKFKSLRVAFKWISEADLYSIHGYNYKAFKIVLECVCLYIYRQRKTIPYLSHATLKLYARSFKCKIKSKNLKRIFSQRHSAESRFGFLCILNHLKLIDSRRDIYQTLDGNNLFSIPYKALAPEDISKVITKTSVHIAQINGTVYKSLQVDPVEKKIVLPSEDSKNPVIIRVHKIAAEAIACCSRNGTMISPNDDKLAHLSIEKKLLHKKFLEECDITIFPERTQSLLKNFSSFKTVLTKKFSLFNIKVSPSKNSYLIDMKRGYSNMVIKIQKISVLES